MSNKIKKYLSNDMWYHATTLDNWNSICNRGILADYNKDTSDALDFGYGFYLSPTKERAEKYISDLLKVGVLIDSEPIILGFEFCPLVYLQNENYNFKILNAYDNEFASFVFENRTKNVRGQNQHNFDIIFGVMSDSIPIKIITEYKMGIISKEEAIEKLKKQTSMKQLSLHSQELCDILKLKEVYVLDIKTNERKELNLNDYYNR
ncbi:DUF3990 domain-containing protein [Anaerosalibacter sp. Marseille-P3206]|uniref:DUF3990 domain-containing protein n=1 Tax=Anaerosalibacter sp. Marseille-P3206 TaxID=1871005 RepID=UPI000984E41B|nr:DUF3990 domain-containing protein [Anaerosalibacter sp. Marseille-P3206]